MAKKYIDADRLKQTIADNVYPVQDAFNSRDYGMFWTGGIEKAIDEQPAVDVVTKWIPAVERLPEEKGEYMVTVEYYGWHGEKGRMLTSTRYTKTKGWHFSNGKVIAWMPLPETYKGDEEGC